MRRKDREISDYKKILQVISDSTCCRLGLYDGVKVYIVPLSFGYTQNEGKLSFYFHGAKEGRKIDLIKRNAYVGFEMDTGHELISSDVACGHSARFKSIMGSGKAFILEDINEKRLGLKTIMEHNTGRDNWEMSDKMVDSVCVFKLEVEDLSCKEHL